MRNNFLIVILSLVFVLFITATIAFALPKQLTNDNRPDVNPSISSGNVAWNGPDSGGWEQIYYYDGSSTKTLTSGNSDNYGPQADGNNVVWYGNTPGGSEIFLYNGSTVTTLTNNNNSDYNPYISGNNVVWYGWYGSYYRVFYYNGSTITTLTTGNNHNYQPRVDGNNAVWYGNVDGDNDIYHYDGTTVTIITNNNINDESPEIDGINVVWNGNVGSNYEIFLYNGSVVTTITNSTFNDYQPRVSGNNIVWYRETPGQRHVMFYNGSNVATLTSGPATNSEGYLPEIDGNNVVWSGWDGEDWEIYHYNGTDIVALTDNHEDDFDPQIDGNKVAWSGCKFPEGQTQIDPPPIETDATVGFQSEVADPDVKAASEVSDPDREIFITDITLKEGPISAWVSVQKLWSWDASKIVSGDFDGDGIDDVAVLYGYNNEDIARLFVFKGNADGSFNNEEIWWTSGGTWNPSNNKLLAGDFNNDGKDDISLVYGYDNERDVRAFVFTSTGSQFNNPVSWFRPGPGNWDHGGSKVVSGDFNNDGFFDLAVLYGYKTERDVKIFVLLSNGSSFSPVETWFNAGAGNWDWDGSKVFSGDFDGNGITDVAVLYGYKVEDEEKLLIFLSNGTTFTGPSTWWSAGPGEFDWNGATPLSGNFNGTGVDDVAYFKSLGGSQTVLSILGSNGVDSIISNITTWDSGAGNWNGDLSKVVAGDFNGGGRDDVAALFNRGNTQSELFLIR